MKIKIPQQIYPAKEIIPIEPRRRRKTRRGKNSDTRLNVCAEGSSEIPRKALSKFNVKGKRCARETCEHHKHIVRVRVRVLLWWWLGATGKTKDWVSVCLCLSVGRMGNGERDREEEERRRGGEHTCNLWMWLGCAVGRLSEQVGKKRHCTVACKWHKDALTMNQFDFDILLET